MNTPTESIKDVRTAYIHERSLIDGDYSAWQRSPGFKSAISSENTQLSERPTSPETEIVRLQIKARRKTLQQYRKMQSKLVGCNLDLMGVIRESECEVHDEVTSLLEQYEKFRGAIGTIRQQSEESVAEAREQLEETRKRTREELERLEEEFQEMERKVADKTSECEVLIKFKGTDKEYHMRVARLNELKLELENLVSEQKTERTELAALVAKHHSNLNSNIAERCREIQATLTAEAVQNIPESLKGLAHQNRVMKREIALHRDNIADTEREVALLNARISDLQHKKFHVQQSTRRTAHLIRDVCTPETELSLDIPTVSILPV